MKHNIVGRMAILCLLFMLLQVIQSQQSNIMRTGPSLQPGFSPLPGPPEWQNVQIREVSGGSYNTMFWSHESSKGQLWVQGQWIGDGSGNPTTENGPFPIFNQSFIQNGNVKRIASFCAGGQHNMIHLETHSGPDELWYWGEQNYLNVPMTTNVPNRFNPIINCTNMQHCTDKFLSVHCGSFQTFLLDRKGDLYSMGGNMYGELGRGNYGVDSMHFERVNVPGGAQQISCWEHCLALVNGTVFSWGSNGYDQLGRGFNQISFFYSDQPAPVNFTTGPQPMIHYNPIQVATKMYSSAVLMGNGDVWIWGNNPGVGYLQVKVPQPLNMSMPVTKLVSSPSFIGLNDAAKNVFVIVDDGQWFHNSTHAQAPYGGQVVRLVDLPNDQSQHSNLLGGGTNYAVAGVYPNQYCQGKSNVHDFAVCGGSQGYCLGTDFCYCKTGWTDSECKSRDDGNQHNNNNNTNGGMDGINVIWTGDRYGYDSFTGEFKAMEYGQFQFKDVREVSAGETTALLWALSGQKGELYSIGNFQGDGGSPTQNNPPYALHHQSFIQDGNVKKIASFCSGKKHNAVLLETHGGSDQLWMWGDYDSNNLPFQTTNSPQPVNLNCTQQGCINPPPSKLRSVHCGQKATYLLSRGGDAFSQGDNTYGQLGRNNFVSTDKFERITDNLGQLNQLVCYDHCIALTVNGTIMTWGSNTDQALGRDTSASPDVFPNSVFINMGPTHPVKVAATSLSSFVLMANGDLWGWGTKYGQDTNTQWNPHKLGLQAPVKQIYSGYMTLGLLTQSNDVFAVPHTNTVMGAATTSQGNYSGQLVQIDQIPDAPGQFQSVIVGGGPGSIFAVIRAEHQSCNGVDHFSAQVCSGGRGDCAGNGQCICRTGFMNDGAGCPDIDFGNNNNNNNNGGQNVYWLGDTYSTEGHRGEFKDIQQAPNQMSNTQVRKIEAGGLTALMYSPYSEKGDLYAVGQFVGDGDNPTIPKSPYVLSQQGWINNGNVQRVASFCAGAQHVAVLLQSHSGPDQLYMWGQYNNGNLPHGTSNTPNHVSNLFNATQCQQGNCNAPQNFRSVTCGEDMTIMIDRVGDPYSMGSNEFGGLGRSQLNQHTHYFDRIYQVSPLKQVKCYKHCIALTDHNNTVLTWGANDYKQLGRNIGVPSPDQNPAVVQFNWGGTFPVQVAATTQASFVLMNNGQVWGWGHSVGTGQVSQELPYLLNVTNIIRIDGGYHTLGLLSGNLEVMALPQQRFFDNATHIQQDYSGYIIPVGQNQFPQGRQGLQSALIAGGPQTHFAIVTNQFTCQGPNTMDARVCGGHRGQCLGSEMCYCNTGFSNPGSQCSAIDQGNNNHHNNGNSSHHGSPPQFVSGPAQSTIFQRTRSQQFIEAYNHDQQGGTIFRVAASPGAFLLHDSNKKLWALGGSAQFPNGHATTLNAQSPIEVMPGQQVRHFCVGRSHVAVLKTDSTLHMFGVLVSGKEAALKPFTTTQTVASPVSSTFYAQAGTLRRLYCSEYTTFAIGDEGKVYSWGEDTLGILGRQNRLTHDFGRVDDGSGMVKNIELFSCNYDTCIAVDESDAVYVWGSNFGGKLGAFEARVDVDLPLKNNDFNAQGDQINQVMTGRHATFILTRDGKLYGAGISQRLGVGETSQTTSSPNVQMILLNTPIQGKIRGVFCIDEITIISGEGQSYGTGLAVDGNIGNPAAPLSGNHYFPNWVQVQGFQQDGNGTKIMSVGGQSVMTYPEWGCDRYSSMDRQQCSSHGQCMSYNEECLCDQGYSGQQCEQAPPNVCFGVTQQTGLVCSGHGNCIALDTCACQLGFSGPQCSIVDQVTCFGRPATDSQVCSGHGQCDSFYFDRCHCQPGYMGEDCSQPTFTCQGKNPDDPAVCSYSGTCTAQDLCSCEGGASGPDCQSFTCFGKAPTDSQVCSGYGQCLGQNFCNCTSTQQDAHAGRWCQDEPKKVYAVGKTFNSAAGQTNRWESTPQGKYQMNEMIIEGQVGLDTAFVVTDKGNAFAMGGSAQSPNGINQRTSVREWVSLRDSSYFLQNKKIATMCYGRSHGLLLDQKGKLYGFGTLPAALGGQTSDVPLPIDLSGTQLDGKIIIQLKCSQTASFVMTKGFNLYVFGDGPQGILGLGQSVTSAFYPTLVTKKRVKILSCNFDHCGALMFEPNQYGSGNSWGANVAQMMSWGRNDFGQLGVGDTTDRFTPHYVDLSGPFSNMTEQHHIPEVTRISTGLTFTGIMLPDGSAWVVGEKNKIGIGSAASQPQLQWIRPKEVTQVSNFYAQEKGIYASVPGPMFGVTGHDAQDGQLGTGQSNPSQTTFSGMRWYENGQQIDSGPQGGAHFAEGGYASGLAWRASECYGTGTWSAFVCHTSGRCAGKDDCQCMLGYEHNQQCEYNNATCHGVDARDSGVCSGNGTCFAGDTCVCFAGPDQVSGSNCDSFACGGIDKNDVSVCSGFGQCVAPGQCQCSIGRRGNNCEQQENLCFGFYANDPQVCSGQGQCTGPDQCQCNAGITGALCESVPAGAITCGTYLSTDPLVCNSRGSCTSSGCNCTSSDYTGHSLCADYSCHGRGNSEPLLVCGGRGTCQGVDQCQCHQSLTLGYSTGPQCGTCLSGWAGQRCNVKAQNFTFMETGDGLKGHLSMYPLNKQRGVECSEILTPASLQKIGLFPICEWPHNEQDTNFEFRIIFGPEATFSAGDQLVFYDQPKTQAQAASRTPQQLTVQVATSSSFEPPVASLFALGQLGSCASLDMDGTGSYAPDRRVLTYQWQAVSGANLAQLNSFLATESFPFVHIPDNMMPAGQTYVFRLLVTSTLSGLKANATQTVVKNNVALPQAFVRGLQTQKVLRGLDYEVVGDYNVDECFTGDRSLSLNWTQTSGPASVQLRTYFDGRVLYFPAKTFQSGGDYVFRFTARSVQDPSRYSQASVTLTVVVEELVPLVFGGNSRFSKTTPFILDGSYSYDPDGVSTAPTYRWTCADSKNPSNPCPTSILFNQSSLAVPANFFSQPSTYTFTMTYSVGDRSKSTQTSVEIVSYQPPAISVKPLAVKYGRGEDIIVESILKSNHTDVTYAWTVEVDGVATALQSVAFTRTDRRVLGINTATFSSGVTVKFTVVASSIISGQGYGFAQTQINTPPTSGSLSISPSSGVSMQDKFKISAISWKDTDEPLKYQFGFIDETKNPQLVGLLSQSATSVEFDVPLGGNITFFCDGYDRYGAKTRQTKVVYVTPSEITAWDGKADLVYNLTQQLDATDLEGTFSQAKIIGEFMKVQTYEAGSCPADCSGHGTCQADFTCQCQTGYNLREDCSISDAGHAKLKDMKEDLFKAMFTTTSNQQKKDTEEDLAMKTETLKSLTQSYDDMTEQSDEYATEVLEDLVSVEDLEVAEDTLQTIGEVFSNLLESAFSKGVEVQQNRSVQTTSDKLRDAADLFVQKTITSNLVAGAKETKISTRTMNVVAKKVAPEDMEQTLNDPSGGSLYIPPGLISDENKEQAESANGVSISMTVIKKNTYASYSTSQNLSTPITNIDFSIGGQALKISGLDPGNRIVFVMTGSFENTLEDYSYVCEYFNTTTDTFRTNGCNRTRLNSTAMTCSCDHATSFGGFLRYAAPNLNILTLDDVANISKLNQDNITTMVVMFVFAILYFVCMVTLEVTNRICVKCQKMAIRYQYQSMHPYEVQVGGYVRPLVEKWKTSHIWFSFVFVPVTQSNFTRMRRLTVIYMIIIGIFATNALTFGQKQENELQMLATIVLCDVLTSPPIMLFTFLFLKTKLKARSWDIIGKKKKNQKKTKKKQVNPAGKTYMIHDDKSSETSSSAGQPHDEPTAQPVPEISLNTNPWALSENKVDTQKIQKIEEQQKFSDTSNPWNHIEKEIPIEDAAQYANEHLVKSTMVSKEGVIKTDTRNIIQIYHETLAATFDLVDRLVTGVQLHLHVVVNRGATPTGALALIVATAIWFALVAFMAYLSTNIYWITRVGIFLISTAGLVVYIVGLEYLYLSSKANRYRNSRMNWRPHPVFVALQIGACMIGIGFLLLAEVAVALIGIFLNIGWENISILTIGVFAVGLCIVVWLFMMIRVPKRPQTTDTTTVRVSRFAGPWFHPWFVYPLYTAAWLWIGLMSFVLVLYGIRFDITDPGSDKTWLWTSFVSTTQNITINKPLIFFFRAIIFVLVIKLFERIFFRTVQVARGSKNQDAIDGGEIGAEHFASVA